MSRIRQLVEELGRHLRTAGALDARKDDPPHADFLADRGQYNGHRGCGISLEFLLRRPSRHAVESFQMLQPYRAHHWGRV